MIGISFYLNDSNAEEHIALAGEKGVKRAFTSLHIPEESGDLASRAKKLLQTAKDHGIEVYADVSARTPAHLGMDSLYDLKLLGVVGLRLDDFFEHETIISLVKYYKIALNASILFEDDLRKLLDSGLKPDQLIAWHNFYPRRETGLAETFFINKMSCLNGLGFQLVPIFRETEKNGVHFLRVYPPWKNIVRKIHLLLQWNYFLQV